MATGERMKPRYEIDLTSPVPTLTSRMPLLGRSLVTTWIASPDSCSMRMSGPSTTKERTRKAR